MQNLDVKSIGLVAPLPPPYGGMANQALQLSTFLKNEGVDVYVVQVNAPYRPAWIGEIKVVRALFRIVPYIKNLWVMSGKVQLVHIFANSGWSWHLFAAPAIWIAKLRKTPVIVNYRGGEADEFFKRSYRIVSLSLSLVNLVLVPSGFLRAVFLKRGIESEIVPNIIDLEKFSNANRNTGNSEITLLVSRSLEKIYDNETAIRAVKIVSEKFSNIKLIIAGTGPLGDELRALVLSLNMEKNVEFVGRVKNSEMSKLYARSDVMINPSLVDNMPISILEALASGVAVVSTNVGGVPFLVDHNKTALLVPPKNAAEMANAILQLLESKKLTEKLVAEGRKVIKQYTWANVKVRLWANYLKVLRN